MKKTVFTIMMTIIFASTLSAQKIKDVSKRDPSYSSVKKVVREGYLSLFSDNKFQAQRNVSRKELAIVIDRILKNVENKRLKLDKTEIRELVNLSRVFKKYLVDFETNKAQVDNKVTLIEAEQKVINHDLSRINYELKQEIEELKKENDNQHLFMWVGIGLSAILGLVI
ncbi:MAG: S-layer homology domain-containing protein [bacterium]|nr:S-layer homology domain-containing protein [bacterium]